MPPYFPDPNDPKDASPFRRPAEQPAFPEPPAPERKPVIVSRPSEPLGTDGTDGKSEVYASLDPKQRRAYARAIAAGVDPPGYRPSAMAIAVLIVLFIASIVVTLPGGRYGRRLAWAVALLVVLAIDWVVWAFRQR